MWNDSIKDDTENLADPQEEESVPTSSGVVAARSKGKSKTSTEGIYWQNNYTIM